MRASTRINKGQFTSARYKDIPNAKTAKPKAPAKPRQPAQAPTANIAIPAINVNKPISDEINENIEMFMSEETPYWRATFYTPKDYIADRINILRLLNIMKKYKTFQEIKIIIIDQNIYRYNICELS